MDALGRLFDIVPVADGVFINLKDCGGVTFLGILAAGDTWTLQEATAASGGTEQNLSVITKSYVQATGTGADTWTKLTQAANAAEVTSSAQDAVVIEVDVEQLSAGFDYVKLTSTSTGTVTAILRDLKVQRKPENLPARGA
ncbi:MAG TPA: hypothetical protein VF174_15950 [Micromonosporaceae bacterium]